MSKLFTREQARDWLRQNGLKDGKSITNAFISEIKNILQEALEEMKVFQGKYKTLRELVPIFDGIKAVQSRVSTRKQRAGVRASM